MAKNNPDFQSNDNAPQAYQPAPQQPGQYQQGQYQQGPGGQWQTPMPPAPPAPAPKKKNWFRRHKILTGIGVLAIIGVIATQTGGDGSEVAVEDGAPVAVEAEVAANEEPAESDGAVPMNTPVVDGDIEFTVTGVETGVTEVGDEYLNETPQGQYVLVTVSATNVGSEAAMLMESDQKILDEQGREFSPDSAASMYMEEDSLWLEEVNPGNTLEGVLVYDMPEDAQPAQIMLMGGLFSSGVLVNLA